MTLEDLVERAGRPRPAVAAASTGAARVCETADGLWNSQDCYRAITEAVLEGIWVGDADGRTVHANSALCGLLGYDLAELLGRRALEFVHTDSKMQAEALGQSCSAGTAGRGELCLVRQDGARTWADVAFRPLLDAAGRVANVLATLVDVTDRKAAVAELERLALVDEPTGLPNRRRFLDFLSEASDRWSRSAGPAVLLVDLDDFKLVNHVLGFDGGDELLIQVAKRLEGGAGLGTPVARFGGDSFGVLCEGHDAVGVAAVAERLLGALRRPFVVLGHPIAVTASVGVATTSDSTTPTTMLRDAETAMYRAKQEGKNRSALYDPAMHVAMADRLHLLTDLRRGLDRGELVTHYQPVVDVRTEQVVGCEALVRWEHPIRGLILPAAFIPAAEDSQLIVDIGAYVLREACARAAGWGAAGMNLRVSVNLSARQLADEAVVNTVEAVLAETRLPPEALMLEVTESGFLGDADHAGLVLDRLKALGVSLAVDDFGTGYSSLSYLRRFPLDALKVDKSFVHGIGESDDDVIVSAVVGLARNLGLSSVAEGVETMAQLDELRRLGCTYAQGHLWGRPLPADEFVRKVGELNEKVSILPESSVADSGLFAVADGASAWSIGGDDVQRAVLDSLTSNVAALDRAGVIIATNRAWRRFAAENRQTAPVGPGVDYLAVCDAARGPGAEWAAKAARGIRAVLRGDREYFTMLYPCHSPSRERWYAMRVSPLALAAGGALVTHMDITEQRRVEDRLGDSEGYFRALFEEAPVGIVRTDLAGRILDANRAFAGLVGYRIDELHDVSTADLGLSFDRDTAASASGAVMARRTPADADDRSLVARDGSERWVSLWDVVVRSPAGQPRFVVISVVDRTERRRLESDLRQAQKLESVGRLAAGIAHEINTPIQFIGDNAQYLGDAGVRLGELCSRLGEAVSETAPSRSLTNQELGEVASFREEIPAAVAQTMDGVQRVARIVQALKSFAHPSAASIAPADINRALTDAVEVARNELKYVADVRAELGVLPLVTCDIGELSQVFLNLLVNAAHAIKDVVGDSGRGTVTITTGAAADTVVIEIADTGAGIPQSIRNAVFDPFFTTKPVGQGSGQGLALARAAIVDHHGGTIDFYTAEGDGTTFRIRLPVSGPPSAPRPTL